MSGAWWTLPGRQKAGIGAGDGGTGALGGQLGRAGIKGRGGCAKCSREVLVTKN